MRLAADCELRYAQSKCRLAQIDQGTRCGVFAAFIPKGLPPFAWRRNTPAKKAIPRHFTQAPAQHQRTHEYIGRPALFNLEFNRRVLPIELHDAVAQDAFALQCDERRGKAKRHAHLQLGGLSRCIVFLLRQQVNAIMILAAKPQLALLGDPHAAGRLNAAALRIGGGDDQFNLACLAQLGIAEQEPARIAAAFADFAKVFNFGLVVVAVEAAHHALAAGGGDAGYGAYL